MHTHFDVEQEIDKKNGGTFINSASIRKYSVKSIRRNENEMNHKMTDNMHFLKSLTKARKKYLLAALLVAIVLVASAIIVPLTINALKTSTPNVSEKRCTYSVKSLTDVLTSQNMLFFILL